MSSPSKPAKTTSPLPAEVLSKIVLKAKKNGCLNQDDIVEALGDIPLTDEIIAYIHKQLQQRLKDSPIKLESLYEKRSSVAQRRIVQTKASRTKEAPLGIDIINSYLKEIGRRPLLSPQDEINLASKVGYGNKAQELLQKHFDEITTGGKGSLSNQEVEQLKKAVEIGKLARDELIERNLRLVVSIAKRYRSRGVPFLDLIQEGNLGLMRAVEKFDPSKGFRFSTYASWWIKQSIARAVLDQSKTIRIPMHLNEALTRMYKTKKTLTEELSREPTDEELAQKMGITLEKLHQLKQLNMDTVSLEQPIGDEAGFNLGDMLEDKQIESPSEITARAILHEAIQIALLELDPREQEIVKLRFGLEDGVVHTLEKVAAKLGVTRERIRQIEMKTLTKLRHPVLAMAVREIYDIKD